ncbi:MAG TPA: TIGR04255 family protein [Kofleriaceae bacterium]|nr:TIGR04255 family protein [Kofleriaceae bacterium]
MIKDPFTDPSPAEVPLANAPLVRVIAQLRFPLVASIEQRDFVAPFQEAIRATYPILRQEQTQQLLFGANIAAPVRSANTAWRFNSEDGHWRVSLTSDFLALETTKYTSRNDFLKRLEMVVAALAQQIDPKLIDRLGVRYVDRISGDALAEIGKLVRPEVRGLSGTLAASSVSHSITETIFAKEDVQVLVRWGQLPPNVTVDPAAIEPFEAPSWILDLDMFSSKPRSFSTDAVIADTRRYMERLYTFFRWAVTDDFLRHYGGR